MGNFLKSSFQVFDSHKTVKRALQSMTGLGVKIGTAKLGEREMIAYRFKCRHSKPPEGDRDAQVRFRIMEVHSFQNYIKRLLVVDTNASYDALQVEICEDPDEPENEIWPCVRVRFCNMRGVAHSDAHALDIIKQLEGRLKDHAASEGKQLHQYRTQVRGTATTWRDAYENELGSAGSI